MSTFRQKFQAKTNWVKPDPEDLVEAPRKSILGRRAGGEAPAAARRGRKAPPAPVTAHRLFPAFAALWFAALFGLGSLVVPGSALGRFVVMTGLPTLMPAAAPPLGFTAHVLVAFALAGFGAAVGFALALRLRPQSEAAPDAAVAVSAAPAAETEAEEVYKVRARDAHPDAPPRRPLVLTEAFADTLADDPAAPEAPLLRRKPGRLVTEPVSDAGPWIPEFAPGGAGPIQPLDLSTLDLADPVPSGPFAEPLADFAGAEPLVAEPDADMDVAEEPVDALPCELPAVQPEVAEPAAAPVLVAATPQLPAALAANLRALADGKWSPVGGAPLDSLGLVQLIERLALAIAARNEADEASASGEAMLPATAIAEPAVEPEPEAEPEFEPGPFSSPRVSASAEDAAATTARDSILRRLGALAAGDATGPAGAVPPFSRPTAPAPDEAAMPLRTALPPAVQTGPETGVPFENDEALRTALATLQRMTARA